MKKIFILSFIFSILNNVAYGENLKIECTVTKIDEKGNFLPNR